MHFTDEAIEIQKGYVPCLWPHSWRVDFKKVNSNPDLFEFKPQVPNHSNNCNLNLHSVFLGRPLYD